MSEHAENATEVPATILVVDDEPSIAQFVAVALRREGYRVLEAENGLRALRVLEGSDERIDVLVSDVSMPGMDGPELARCAAVQRPDLGCVFMTGYATHGDVPGLGEAPLCLQKPFARAELLRVVASALSARQRR